MRAGLGQRDSPGHDLVARIVAAGLGKAGLPPAKIIGQMVAVANQRSESFTKERVHRAAAETFIVQAVELRYGQPTPSPVGNQGNLSDFFQPGAGRSQPGRQDASRPFPKALR